MPPLAPRQELSLLVRTGKVIFAVAGAGIVAVTAYAARSWAIDIARAEAVTQSSQYTDLPSRMRSIEEFRGRQERAQDATDQKLEAINNAVISLRTAEEVNHNYQVEVNRRIMDQLDRIARRQTPPTP